MQAEKEGSTMKQYDAFIDAYLKGDSLFRFVYVPERKELFLEDELEEQDNGKFLYVPFKDSRELYLRMATFSDRQSKDIEEKLYRALSAPSPIDQFQKAVKELDLTDTWEREKRAYALENIITWFETHHLTL